MSTLNTPVKTLALAITLASTPMTLQAADNNAGVQQIEEVTVTARRRAENLQDIPVSVTAFTSSDIEEMGVTDVTHISELTPNLSIQPNTGGNDGAVACMRGLCRTDFPLTEDPMVGVYLDGVFISKSIGSLFDMAELERVEVLRGPQGTLYGKNTLGGAILMHTRKPSGEYGSKTTLTAGNFGRKDAKVYAEFPIVDQLAGSLSLLSKNRDPFVENTQGSDRWDEDNMAARGALQWKTDERLTVDYAIDWQKKRETPLAVSLVAAEDGLGASYGGDVRTDYEDTISTYGGSYSNVDIDGHNLSLSFDINDGMTLKSITGYRDMKNDMVNNSAGASSPVLFTHDTAELEAKSQEFQLSGVAMDKFIEYVVGVFYFAEEGEYTNDQEIEPFAVHNFSFTSIDNTSKALFGEVTLNFTEQLEASLGLRYTDEEREGQHTVTDVGTGFTYLDTINQTYLGAPQTYKTDIDESNVSPRLSVSYQFTDDLMTFATYSNGFKSGGFNARSFTPLQWGPYDDAEVDSVEFGMKSNWLENRIKFNVTAFYEEIKDIQAQVNATDPNGQGGFSVVIQNAAEATIKGAEAEIVVRLVPGLDISGGYGYTDAEYDEYISIVDVADDRAFEYTPKNSYNLSLNYQFPQFTDIGNLTARLDWSGQSKVRFTPKISGNDDIAQDKYDILNARVSFDEVAAANGSLGFSLWVKNLTDEEYKIGGFEFPAGAFGRLGISQWGEPRTYGLDVVYRYGSMK